MPGQLKNAISSVVRAIRTVRPGMRIYVSDCLPIRAQPVLGLKVDQHNRMLRQALRSLRISHGANHEKVYLLEMGRYFQDDWFTAHKKAGAYINDQGVLTKIRLPAI